MLIRLARTLRDVIYSAYCWLSFLFLSLGALLLMFLVPGAARRRRIAGATGRTWLWLVGMRLRVTGVPLPDQGCVVVANHASYLDGVILQAALPPRFAFVIKREMDRIPLASLLLRRIGSEFVDRFNRHKGAVDARRVLRRVSSGDSVVFFPEGTFSKQPGLLRFHTGAFATAVRAACPVVPVVIRGTRKALPWNKVVPTRTTIEVRIYPPLLADPTQRDAAIVLRDQVRELMLAEIGEPDLALSETAQPSPLRESA